MCIYIYMYTYTTVCHIVQGSNETRQAFFLIRFLLKCEEHHASKMKHPEGLKTLRF